MNPVSYRPGPPPPWIPMLPPNPPASSAFWDTNNVYDRLRELQETIDLAMSMQKELELLNMIKDAKGSMEDAGVESRKTSFCRFSEYLKNNKIDLGSQELLSVEAANSLISKLRVQLEPFRIVTEETSPWEEKSAAVRLATKREKSMRNKCWRKRKRKRVAEMCAKERERFDQADQEADEWRAREIAKDIAKRKVEKMKEIAKLKAKEERNRLESELEQVLIVEKLQELRSIRIDKLKKQGHFLPEEDDKFLERVRAAVEEEERLVMAAADTDAAKDAIATAEESRKVIQGHGPDTKDPSSNKDVDKESQAKINEDDNKKDSSAVTIKESGKLGSEGQGYGGTYDSLAGLPVEFYHYYHGSNTDMGTLIEVRRTWDAYIRPGGSRIPGHWVQPPPPADEIWASYLIDQYRAEIKRLQESESEIKALSVNYAALLKEKEDHISRLNTENGSLKKNLNETNAILSASRSEALKTSTSSPSALMGSTDQLPKRQHRLFTPVKNRSTGNQIQNGILSKQDGLSNGSGDGGHDIIQSKMDAKYSNLPRKEKELTDLLEEKNRSLVALQGIHELQMKQLKTELEKEREMLANVQLNLQEEHKLNGTFQEELKSLQMDKDKTYIEMSNIQKELNEKISEIKRLQMELSRREDEDADASVDSLKRVILTLEKENTSLKLEKEELQDVLNKSKIFENDKFSLDTSDSTNKLPSISKESSGSYTGKEEMEISLQKLQKELKEACRERDKVLQELNRLKQHLLEKESEESDKMDEDIKIIEELQQINEYQRAQILHLEKALKQAIARQEEIKLINHSELKNSKELIDDLNRKLSSCMSTIDAKNVEILNLQTALGQYYAEIEAKERLESNLALAREEMAKLSQLLKDEQQQADISKREKEEILAKLSQAERTFGEGKSRVNKLEEDNTKLRRALEQSMTKINRMSVDSDYFVDRRIVIKLLVTYFQRNHSKEVLDLMVRMLGFSDEDKQRIGGAQQGSGKGVVRGVLGLPGRFVGGILGGGSAEGHANMASENQSFADLWVDFLLKETEARERESAEVTAGSKENPHGKSPNVKGETFPDPRTSTASVESGFSRTDPSLSQSPNPQSLRGNYMHSENSNSEFSAVPLTSSDGNSRISRLLPKY